MLDQRFAFGTFVLDIRRGMLLRDGTPVTTIGSRGLALLKTLVQAEGKVVTRSELMDAAWSNASVEESNLTVQIAALRKCLGASADSDEWIMTVPRIGYRFAGALRVDKEVPVASTSHAPLLAPVQNPSIAVLPFNNMSSDPEQDYFAEGLSEDLITDLSKVPGLLVIARNSSFAYGGKPLDIRLVARELNVRYIVEGSVRRAADRVRINAELIDATDNSHLWADRFDRDLADIFAIQDEVVGTIVRTLADVLPTAPPVLRRRSTNIEAYDLFVRARPLVTRSPDGNRSAQPLLERAVKIDPGFAEAYAWLAMSFHFGWMYWGQPPYHAEALAAAQRAVSLEPKNADGHMTLGYLRAYEFKLAEGVAEFETTLRLNPNHADAWALFADLRVLEGKPNDAVECAKNAFRLNPHPPSHYYWLLGWAEYAARRYHDAVETLRHEAARGTGSQRILAGALAQLGRVEESREVAAEFLITVPHFSVRQWASTQPFRHEADLQHFIEGYVKSGLPK
jgi:TolB-like protein